MPLETVFTAYQRFRETEACQQNPRLVDNLRTVLRRYILPSYGVALEQVKGKNLDAYLEQIPLAQLMQDASKLLKGLESTNTNDSQSPPSKGGMANYRSTLNRFFDWVYTQQVQGIPSSTLAVGSRHIPRINSGDTLAKARLGGRNLTAHAYALKETELTQKLQDQFQQLQSFLLDPAPPKTPIKSNTFQVYQLSILCFLGWLTHIQSWDLEQVTLQQMTDLQLLQQFVAWGLEQRQNSTGWALNIVRAGIAVTQWLVTDEHIPVAQLTALQAYAATLSQQYHQGQENSAVMEPVSSNALTYEESLQVLQYLKDCCAPLYGSGIQRSESAILKSWQRYLIVALLTYTPLNQRQIRELSYGRSLLRDEYGYQVFLNTKTKAKQSLRLPPPLTPELDTWFQNLWPHIPAQEQLVFTRLGASNYPESLGALLSSRDISDLVASAVHKATSILFSQPKRLTSHTLQQVTLRHLEQLSQSAALAARLTGGLTLPAPDLPSLADRLTGGLTRPAPPPNTTTNPLSPILKGIQPPPEDP